MLTTLLLASTIGLSIFYLYRKRRINPILNGIELPGPPVHWFWGSIKCLSRENMEHFQIPKWTQQYGKIWCWYEGNEPTIITSDVSFLEQVFIKQFNVFSGRKQIVLQEPPESKHIDMFSAEGKRWKRLRTIINPVFTESKMRDMQALISASTDVFMNNLRACEEKAEPVNIAEPFKHLTLDVIGECAFGVQVNTQKSHNQKLFLMLKILFEDAFGNFIHSPLMKFMRAIPELRSFFRNFLKFMYFISPSEDPEAYVIDSVKEVIKVREENETLVRVDLLQLLLNAGKEYEQQLDMNGNEIFVPTSSKKPAVEGKYLTKGEIYEAAYLFLLAGYETSSTALAYITHCLANHPDIQDRVCAEINNVFGDMSEIKTLPSAEFNKKLKDLTFMENVIRESIRLYPIVPIMVTRRCMEDTMVNGYKIRKGTNIMPDVQTIHQDIEIWGPTDPKLFDPDRFNTPRHPIASLTFGAGPRRCIGERFAMMEIKTILVNLLSRYHIKSLSDSIELRYGVTTHPKELMVSFEARQFD